MKADFRAFFKYIGTYFLSAIFKHINTYVNKIFVLCLYVVYICRLNNVQYILAYILVKK